MSTLAPLRVNWRSNFPEVVLHTSVRVRDHSSNYAAAKRGDADAALALAEQLVAPGALATLQHHARGSAPILMPVVADETGGFNAIPDALAQVIGRRLELEVAAGAVVQINKVGHTRAPSFQRLVTPAIFEGPVERGRSYILVDDHVGLGGTLANLRGHLEHHGGFVIAMTTLTESREGRRIALTEATRSMLWERHGRALDDFWRAEFGHSLDQLTELEAQQLCRQPSLAAIADFLAQAAVEARGRGLSPAHGTPD